MSERALVLVVDDDPLMRELYAEALADSFELRFAPDGREALAQLAQGPRPAAVVMDVAMPELDGYETCRRLRQDQSEPPPVVFVSSHDRLEDRMRGYDAGGSDYLIKPFETSELVAKLRLQMQADAQRRAANAERDEAVQAVLSSADMAGELGVVLDFQRELNQCDSLDALARQLLGALARYGLDGCLRVQAGGRPLSRSSEGECTSLELSILDMLAHQTEGPRIRPFQHNTSFNFGRVILFVRQLAMLRGTDMDEETRQRHGRAIDNVALLLEAAVSRLQAIEGANAVRDLGATRRLIDVATQGLHDAARRNEAMAASVRMAFEHLQAELEESFIHLGLTTRQEDLLTELVKSHAGSVLQTLEQGRAVEHTLQRVIADLQRGL